MPLFGKLQRITDQIGEDLSQSLRIDQHPIISSQMANAAQRNTLLPCKRIKRVALQIDKLS